MEPRNREEKRRRNKLLKYKMNPPNHKVTPEEEKQQRIALQLKLAEEHQLTLTKGELLVIFNLVTRITLGYGDTVNPDSDFNRFIKPLIKKIEPIIVVDSNIEKPTLTGLNKN